jgi:citrate lyase subunit beta/citryl-CoA lyase
MVKNVSQPSRLRRSCLSVPGSSEKMLAKAPTLDADMVFCDLEDSVAPIDKTDATRRRVAAALAGEGWKAKTRVVRVNGVLTPWCLRDIDVVLQEAGHVIDCIMVPKVSGADQVAFLHHLLGSLETELELPRRIGLEIQIEDARGAENLAAIADASDRIETLIFGPGDYAASLGIRAMSVGSISPDYPGDQWHWIISRLVVTARARGIQAIDGPYAAIRDLAGFREAAKRSEALGCEGKWVLHPDQIPIANEVYSPSLEDYRRAEALIAAYTRAAATEHRGAIMWEGMMVDEASRQVAETIVAKGRASGLALQGEPGGADQSS